MNELNHLELAAAIVFFGSVICMLASLITLNFTLVKRVRIALKSHCGLEDSRHWVVLAGNYSRYVIFSGFLKKDRYKAYDYEGFDFRRFASATEVMLSHLLWVSYALVIGIAFIACIADFFGFIDMR
jgi:hypothetical protein